MSRRRSWLCALLPALIALALPTSALAATLSHPLVATINGGYEDACGVAFDGESLFVSDYYHDQIVGPNGTIANEDPGGGPCKLGFDAGGNLYVDNWQQNVVRFGALEIPNGSGEVIDSSRPTGLAVDPASGDLYVAHRTYIAKYTSPVHAGETPTVIGKDEHAAYYGLAVSDFPATAGYLYVADAATNTVKVFGPSGNPIEELDGAATPQGHFTYFVNGELVVDNSPTSPSYGHLYVLDAVGHGTSGEAVIDEFNAAGDYRAQIAGITDAEPSGIAIKPSNGNVYASSGNTEGSLVFEYGPTAPAFTLTAKKSGAGGGTVSTSPSGISCSPACAAEFDQEERITLVAIPDPHSDFTGWTVEGPGSEPCPGTGTCSLLLFGDTEVTANFEPAPQKKLEVSLAGQGTGTVSSEPAAIDCASGTCSEEFAENLPVVLTATPAPHNKVASWSGCDSTPQPNVCEVTMSEAKAVSVTFAPIPQLALSVTEIGTGQGTVTSYPPGISCPGNCSGSFDEASTVYLMAAPSPGTGFGGFSGGGCEGTATLCAVTMSSATEVSARFTGTAAGPAQAAALRPAAVGSGASFSLAAVRTAGTSALLTVKAPEAGTLLLSGTGLRSAKHHLSAGTSRVRIALARRARNALFAHHRLRLRLTAGFLPAGGGTPGAAAATLRFRTNPVRGRASYPGVRSPSGIGPNSPAGKAPPHRH